MPVPPITFWLYNPAMKIKVIVHQAEEGGYWAEVPAIPGAQPREKRLKICFKTSMKLSKAVCRWMFSGIKTGTRDRSRNRRLELPLFPQTYLTRSMKTISGKELARILERKGWILLRVQGKPPHLRQERR